jgi:hypothetical protein
MDSELFRRVFKVSYVSRGRYRTSRRSIADAVRLGLLAKELTPLYISIVRWDGFERELRVSIGVESG